MLVDRHDHALLRQAELAAGAGHDADVGLVRNQPVDLLGREIRLRERFDRDLFEHVDRELEHGLSVHVQERAAVDHAAVDVARRTQDVRVAAVRMQRAAEHARLFRRGQDHRAGTVAEQHAGRAVLEVENARERLRADHERRTMLAAADEAVGRRHRVREARTHGLYVECRAAVLDAELVLQQARGAREHEIGGRSRDDDQVDRLRIDTGRFDRTTRRLEREIARRDVRCGEMARMDARARHDPFIARLDAFLRKTIGQLLVRDAVGRQVAARAEHAGIESRLGHLCFRGLRSGRFGVMACGRACMARAARVVFAVAERH
ncbi:Uncharacterised protein [Clostridium sporogenes]|nr:Uncharacterised protein [Clostridium sporogenes]